MADPNGGRFNSQIQNLVPHRMSQKLTSVMREIVVVGEEVGDVYEVEAAVAVNGGGGRGRGLGNNVDEKDAGGRGGKDHHEDHNQRSKTFENNKLRETDSAKSADAVKPKGNSAPPKENKKRRENNSSNKKNFEDKRDTSMEREGPALRSKDENSGRDTNNSSNATTASNKDNNNNNNKHVKKKKKNEKKDTSTDPSDEGPDTATAKSGTQKVSKVAATNQRDKKEKGGKGKERANRRQLSRIAKHPWCPLFLLFSRNRRATSIMEKGRPSQYFTFEKNRPLPKMWPRGFPTVVGKGLPIQEFSTTSFPFPKAPLPPMWCIR
jgi:hypothetical protein